ncbi:hypothetical protein IQ255_11820 [Pleurocapsales cyanobacterium LEGE 10410]|nr:hypothetical protein [Pleurocapsales cyanobacterium LEGE 10410]
MKLSNIYKLSGTGLLAMSLAIIPFTKSGLTQVNTDPDVAVIETEDDGFDWGWLGLLGLLGLGGLAGKSNKSSHHEVRNTEPFPEAPASRSDSQHR